jgi:hypothetical protein
LLLGLSPTNASVRVYDQLRCQRDSVSRYTSATQSDTDCDLMPSN